MALKCQPGFEHRGAHVTEEEAREFDALREELGVSNRRLIALGVDALKREIEADPRSRKIPPLRTRGNVVA